MPREKKANTDETVSKKTTKSQTASKEKIEKSSKAATDNSNVKKEPTTSKKASIANAKNTSKTTARNTKSAKNVKKQARANDDRIKKIISEQLNSISEMEKRERKLNKEETDKIKADALDKGRKIKTSIEKKDKSNEPEAEKVKKKKSATELGNQKVTVKSEKVKKIRNEKNKAIPVEKQKDNLSYQAKDTVKKEKFDPKVVEEKIEEKKKLPKEEKNKAYKKIFINLLVACVISLYLLFVNLGFSNIQPSKFAVDLNVFSITLIAITIFLFEVAYKKDSGTSAIFGIEILFLAIITLGFTYINVAYTEIIKKCVNCICLVYVTYYMIKSIIIYIYQKRRYKNSISDIKELVSE